MRSRSSNNLKSAMNGPQSQAPRPTQPYRRPPPSRENSNEENVITEVPEEKEQLMFTAITVTSYILLITIVVVVIALLVLTFPNPDDWRPFDITGRDVMEDSSQTTSQRVSYVGGWRKGDRETELLLNTTICNIDRKFSHELTEKEFEQTYRYKKPVIVHFHEGAAGWTDPFQWTRDDLMEKYSVWDVASGKSNNIVRNGGSGDRMSSFQDYINGIMNNKDSSSEPMYVFDREFYKDSSLPSTINVPSYLEVKDERDDSIFFLGASKSGVSFHKHADAWNGVVYGRKRWFLYAPQNTPPGGVWPGFSSLDWFQHVYPRLEEKDKPLECIQEPGEILYLPESFYHATLNIGDTIAVGIQKINAATEIEKLFYRAKDLDFLQNDKSLSKDERHKLLMENVECFEELHRLLPGTSRLHIVWNKLNDLINSMHLLYIPIFVESSEVLCRLGFAVYNLNHSSNTAIKITEQAVEKDPYFVVAILNIAEYYKDVGDTEKAEEQYIRAKEVNPRYWQIYADYGDFLAALGRSKDAAEMYLVGTKLEPGMMPFWARLSDQQYKNGDLEAAAKSRQQALKLQRMQH
ncbi:uncharacterized protein LOC144442935 [Glandiceps talaboti]